MKTKTPAPTPLALGQTRRGISSAAEVLVDARVDELWRVLTVSGTRFYNAEFIQRHWPVVVRTDSEEETW